MRLVWGVTLGLKRSQNCMMRVGGHFSVITDLQLYVRSLRNKRHFVVLMELQAVQANPNKSRHRSEVSVQTNSQWNHPQLSYLPPSSSLPYLPTPAICELLTSEAIFQLGIYAGVDSFCSSGKSGRDTPPLPYPLLLLHPPPLLFLPIPSLCYPIITIPGRMMLINIRTAFHLGRQRGWHLIRRFIR